MSCGGLPKTCELGDVDRRAASQRETTALPAFYELALEAHFRATKIAHLHPTLGTGRPDFLIHTATGPVYVEVATAMDDEEWYAHKRRADLIFRIVNNVSPGYAISLDLNQRRLTTDVKPRRVRDAVLRAKSATDAGALPLGARQTVEGTHISFALMAKHAAGGVSAGYKTEWIGSNTSIGRIINTKARAYPEIKTLGLPYVVVLCSGSHFWIDDEQVTIGVYGALEASFGWRGRATRRMPCATLGRLLREPHCVGCSVCVWPAANGTLHAKVLHHQSPSVPLPRSVFARIPQSVFAEPSADVNTLSFDHGRTEFVTD